MAKEQARKCACLAARVDWEFWTSSNDGCGNGCDRQAAFKRDVREDAEALETVSAGSLRQALGAGPHAVP